MKNKKNGNKNNAGLYIRVSTLNQIDRDSLKTQEERLIAYCKANAIDNYGIYRDSGYSAKDTSRPALEKLLADIKSGIIDSVFVIKLDRITRSISDLLKLIDFFKKYDVNFASITESIDTGTAMGRFMQHLLGLIAQLEREVTAERVAIDMQHRATQGKWNGGIVPYGYTTQKLLINKFKNSGIDPSSVLEVCPEEKKLYVDSEESEVVKWIYNTFLETNSVRRTTIQLNERGIKTRKGQLWAKTTIHRILTSPIYIGKIWYGKRKTDTITGKLVNQDKSTWIIVNGEHDRIISDKVFETIHKLLSSRSGKPTKPGRHYLISGVLRCGFCGASMSGHTFTKKTTGKTYSYYKCYNKLQKGTIACNGLSLPAEKLEDFITQNLMELSENQTFLSDKEKMISILKSKIKDDDFEKEIKRIDKNNSKLRNRLDTLIDKLEQGMIADEDFQPRYEKIKTDLATLENEKTRLLTIENSRDVSLKNLETSFGEITSFSKNWEYLDDVGKSLRIKSILKEVRATKDKIDMDIYLDVADLSRTDTDSWPPPA